MPQRPDAPGPFAFLSRRRFLRVALGTGAVVVGAGAGATYWLRGPVPPVDGLRELSRAGYRTLTHIVAATFRTDLVDVAALDLPRAFDGFLANEHPANVRDLSRALTLVELGPLVMDGMGTTFSRLTPEEREAYWAGWATSDRLVKRQVSLAFRKFLNMVFYDRPEVWPTIGYPGPSMWALMGGPPPGAR